jgi:hypothetical protein
MKLPVNSLATIYWAKFLAVFVLENKMNIVLTADSTKPSTKKSNIQIKFDRLWTQVKKKQKRNDKLKLEMDELVQVYNQTVLPKEKEYEQPLCALIEKLITFYTRKSLAAWQRDQLERWFTEVLNQLGQYNPEKAEHYAGQFDKVFADHKGITVQDLDDNTAKMESELDAIMAEMKKMDEQQTSSNQQKNPQDDIFGFNNDAKASFDDFDFDQFSENAFNQADTNPRTSQLINEKWIRNLFRRTARALHPDKEQDPVKREHKQSLMSELLNARDTQDVMTMMLMYNQHVDDSELVLGEDEMQSLCGLLQEQHHELDEARWDIIQQSPLHESLHETLHGATKKTRDKKLKQHLENVQDGIDYQFEVVSHLRNLARLKEVLEDRADRFEPSEW